MARPKAKSTYVMDVETVTALERVARRWRVSKSEALRRAIRAADEMPTPPPRGVLEGLDELQASLRLTPGRARTWTHAAHEERRAAAVRSETRSGATRTRRSPR